MSKRKKILLWSIAAIVVLVAVFMIFNRGKDKIEYETETAEKRDVLQTVSVTGELVSEQEIDLNFEIGGRIKSISAYVGKRVAKGEVVGMIDDDILGQEYNRAEAALNQALANAGANDDLIREAEQAKDNAKRYLEEADDLEDQKVDAAEEAYEDAKDYYDDALIYYNQVVADNGVNSSSAKNAKLTLDSAKSQKNAAAQAVDTTKKAQDLAIISAENALDSAKEGLRTVESDFSKRSSDSAVQSAQAAYNIALVNLEKAALKAPVSGVITEINYKVGEVLGSAVGGSFAKIVSSDYIVEADVPESDIMKIKNKHSATLMFDAFDENETFEASVIEIEPASTVIQDVVYYKIKLGLQNVDMRLKPGMSTDVDVHTAERRDVIAIPRRAVNEDGSKQTVDVLISETEIKNVEVKTGLRGDKGDVEILSGIEQGDQVVTIKKEKK